MYRLLIIIGICVLIVSIIAQSVLLFDPNITRVSILMSIAYLSMVGLDYLFNGRF